MFLCVLDFSTLHLNGFNSFSMTLLPMFAKSFPFHLKDEFMPYNLIVFLYNPLVSFLVLKKCLQVFLMIHLHNS